MKTLFFTLAVLTFAASILFLAQYNDDINPLISMFVFGFMVCYLILKAFDCTDKEIVYKKIIKEKEEQINTLLVMNRHCCEAFGITQEDITLPQDLRL